MNGIEIYPSGERVRRDTVPPADNSVYMMGERRNAYDPCTKDFQKNKNSQTD